MRSPIGPPPASPNTFARFGRRTVASTAIAAGFSRSPSDLAGRLFVIAYSLGIAVGLIATAGMALAATAFATAGTFVVPLVATFEGFHDAGGANAVTVTGSWAMAIALTAILTFLLSFVALRCSGSSAGSDTSA